MRIQSAEAKEGHESSQSAQAKEGHESSDAKGCKKKVMNLLMQRDEICHENTECSTRRQKNTECSTRQQKQVVL